MPSLVSSLPNALYRSKLEDPLLPLLFQISTTHVGPSLDLSQSATALYCLSTPHTLNKCGQYFAPCLEQRVPNNDLQEPL